jgi:iron(III) transport system substrate-binding protein
MLAPAFAVLCALRAVAATGPVDDDVLIAKAKAEGSVSVYTSTSTEQANAIAERFTAQYGIPAHILRLNGDALAVRIVTEQRAGHNEADAVSVAGIEGGQLAAQGLFAEYRAPESRALLPGMADPGGLWATDFIASEAIAYNPARVRALGIRPPAAWEDFTGPEWRTQFGLPSDSIGWYSALLHYYGRERADRLLRAYAANQPQLLATHTQGLTLITAGEVAAVASAYGPDTLALARKGQPVQLVNPTPTVLELHVVCVMKNATHPNAARLFARWTLSRETQAWMIASLGRVSGRKDLKNDPDLFGPRLRTAIIDPADGVHYGDELKAFHAIFNIP